MRILVVDNYDSFVFNLVQYLGQLGVDAEVWRNDDARLDDRDAVAGDFDGILLSPGPGTPQRAGATMDLVTAAAKTGTPLLGVCLGHQAIGQAYGGEVVRAPQPMHGKLSKITHTSKGLFKALPKSFEVTRYHSLMVERASLPSDLAVTAKTNDGLIMGLQHKTHPVHGVQFHPESIASEHGHALLANFLELAGMSPRRRNAKPTRHAA
jgi:para-aminobenzoate synthetase component 2